MLAFTLAAPDTQTRLLPSITQALQSSSDIAKHWPSLFAALVQCISLNHITNDHALLCLAWLAHLSVVYKQVTFP